MSIETLDLLVSNGVIFVLYNLYFISQIDNLEIRVDPLNQNGSSKHLVDYFVGIFLSQIFVGNFK
jgi:hypothetical protein